MSASANGKSFGVKLTHPDRIYWPDACVTKQGLAEYYADVWKWMREVMGGRHAPIMGRVADPNELASILLLLGSRANTYIVGANVAGPSIIKLATPFARSISSLTCS